MNRPFRLIPLTAAWCVPLVALAASSAQQDYFDAAASRPDLQNGAMLYAACAACHGASGEGNAVASVPRIAGQWPQVIIRQLVNYRHAQRMDPQMERNADRHLLGKAQDVADVAAYAASLRAPVPAQTGRGEYLALGAAIYGARCSGCHGAEGQGDAAAVVPRLAGQHEPYLLRQFHDALEGRRPQLGLSHDRYLHDLDRDALLGLADMLSRAPGRRTSD